MKKRYLAAICGGALLVGFALLPVDPVRATKVTEVVYVNAAAYETYRDDRQLWGSARPWETHEADKSGLRRAIEGRLKWLGIAGSLAIALPCATQDNGKVVCRYL